MSKSVRNEEFHAAASVVYAKGGFVPRRKGQRKVPYDTLPDFPNQQGQVHEDLELRLNPIAKVEFLGTFPGYDQHGGVIQYRAQAITLNDGRIIAGYSRDADQYVMCLHTEFLQP